MTILRLIRSAGLWSCITVAATPLATPLAVTLPVSRLSNFQGPNTNTGTITGIVVLNNTADELPLRRVTVIVSGGDLKVPQAALTDDTGRFVFGQLAPGTYSVTLHRPSFVPAVIDDAEPVRVQVTSNQKVALKLRMQRGAALTGEVRLESGQPAEGFGVLVLRQQIVSGLMRLKPVLGPGTQVATDDRGVYRIFGLQPGTYVIQVFPPPQLGVMQLSTDAEVSWIQTRNTNAPPVPGQVVTVAPVFYPGVTRAIEATPITIAAGDDRNGLDVMVRHVPIASVTGTIINPDGRPMDGRVEMTPVSESGSVDRGQGGLAIPSVVSTSSDGMFRFGNVTPGRYRLTASGGRSGQMMWASEDIYLVGQNTQSTTLRLQPGATVSGTITADGPSLPPTGLKISMLRLSQSRLSLDMPVSAASLTSAVAGDGSFVITGVPPGDYRVTLLTELGDAGRSNWTLKAAVFAGRDVADLALVVQAGQHVSGGVLAITDKISEVSGSIVDQAGQPAASISIIVFSVEPAYWTAGSRRVQHVRPLNDGTFRVVGLPAGEYCLSVVTGLADYELTDKDFLQQLIPGAVRLTLADGEKRFQSLKVQR